MRDEPRPEPLDTEDEVDENDLEYRPFVKYVGLGLVLCTMAGSFYAAYSMGYNDGVASGEVSESINSTAVQNLQYVMQMASSDDAMLAKMAQHPDESLAWIRDQRVRAEVQWELANIMMNRGLMNQVQPLLENLLGKIPSDPVWAARMLVTADNLAGADCKEAARYYRMAADCYKKLQLKENYVSALAGLAALYSNMIDNAALKTLLKETEPLGADAISVRSVIQLHLALDMKMHADAGAGAVFDALLKEVQKRQPNVPPTAAVCAGIAMVEQGLDAALAANLLHKGESALGSSQAETLVRLMALRYLAHVEESRGLYQASLALLSRAEGAASGRVPKQNAFWPCLYVQRGWLHFVVRDTEHALRDFSAALKHTKDIALKVQALEGAARSNAAQGKVEEAAVQASECLALRRAHFANQQVEIGRILLVQAQICDQKDDLNAAADLYGQAANLLVGDSEEVRGCRLDALQGRAYILTQQGQWAQAAPVWEAIIPLVSDQKDLLEEARSQLRHCRNSAP